MSEYHVSVLLDESVSALISSSSGIYADATFGGGGHTSEILRRLSPEGRVIAFDRDSDAIANKPDDSRLTLVRSDFRWLHNHILHLGYKDGIDGVLADLGVSSHQFDTAERGFSFRYEAPLDMRMNQEASLNAADIVNTYEQEDLEKILRLYGEVDNSRRIAQLICKAREAAAIQTTTDLGKAIESALPKFAEHKFLAKVYQALRIEVNQEMKSLEKFLSGAAKALKPGGKMVIITYHSLEDRMVKNIMKTGNIEGKAEQDFFGNVQTPFRLVNNKVIVASDEEVERNPRSRSAKLRIAEKK